MTSTKFGLFGPIHPVSSSYHLYLMTLGHKILSCYAFWPAFRGTKHLNFFEIPWIIFEYHRNTGVKEKNLFLSICEYTTKSWLIVFGSKKILKFCFWYNEILCHINTMLCIIKVNSNKLNLCCILLVIAFLTYSVLYVISWT